MAAKLASMERALVVDSIHPAERCRAKLFPQCLGWLVLASGELVCSLQVGSRWVSWLVLRLGMEVGAAERK